MDTSNSFKKSYSTMKSVSSKNVSGIRVSCVNNGDALQSSQKNLALASEDFALVQEDSQTQYEEDELQKFIDSSQKKEKFFRVESNNQYFLSLYIGKFLSEHIESSVKMFSMNLFDDIGDTLSAIVDIIRCNNRIRALERCVMVMGTVQKFCSDNKISPENHNDLHHIITMLGKLFMYTSFLQRQENFCFDHAVAVAEGHCGVINDPNLSIGTYDVHGCIALFVYSEDHITRGVFHINRSNTEDEILDFINEVGKRSSSNKLKVQIVGADNCEKMDNGRYVKSDGYQNLCTVRSALSKTNYDIELRNIVIGKKDKELLNPAGFTLSSNPEDDELTSSVPMYGIDNAEMSAYLASVGLCSKEIMSNNIAKPRPVRKCDIMRKRSLSKMIFLQSLPPILEIIRSWDTIVCIKKCVIADMIIDNLNSEIDRLFSPLFDVLSPDEIMRVEAEIDHKYIYVGEGSAEYNAPLERLINDYVCNSGTKEDLQKIIDYGTTLENHPRYSMHNNIAIENDFDNEIEL